MTMDEAILLLQIKYGKSKPFYVRLKETFEVTELQHPRLYIDFDCIRVTFPFNSTQNYNVDYIPFGDMSIDELISFISLYNRWTSQLSSCLKHDHDVFKTREIVVEFLDLINFGGTSILPKLPPHVRRQLINNNHSNKINTKHLDQLKQQYTKRKIKIYYDTNTIRPNH